LVERKKVLSLRDYLSVKEERSELRNAGERALLDRHGLK